MLRITEEQLADMIAHARAGAPEEICGILAGRDGVVSRVYHGTNVATSPTVRYDLDPRQQLEIMREIDSLGETMVAIYHSHPNSQAYPSRTDQELAFYPDSVYVIISLADPTGPVVRAFRLRDKKIEEEQLVVDG